MRSSVEHFFLGNFHLPQAENKHFLMKPVMLTPSLRCPKTDKIPKKKIIIHYSASTQCKENDNTCKDSMWRWIVHKCRCAE